MRFYKIFFWVILFSAGALPGFLSADTAQNVLSIDTAKNNQEEFYRALSLLKSSDEEHVIGALSRLQMLAPKMKREHGAEVIAGIAPLWQAHDLFLMHSVSATTLSYGEFAAPLMDQMIARIRENRSDAATFSVQILRLLGKQANKTQDVVIDYMQGNEEGCLDGAKTLSDIGALSPLNVERCRKLLDTNSSLAVRFWISLVLLRNNDSSGFVLENVAICLKTDDSNEQYEFLKAIGDYGLLKIYPSLKGSVAGLARDASAEDIRELAQRLIDAESKKSPVNPNASDR